MVLSRQAIEKGARNEPEEPVAAEHLGIGPRTRQYRLKGTPPKGKGQSRVLALRRFRCPAGSLTELPRSAPRLGVAEIRSVHRSARARRLSPYPREVAHRISRNERNNITSLSRSRPHAPLE